MLAHGHSCIPVKQGQVGDLLGTNDVGTGLAWEDELKQVYWDGFGMRIFAS